MTVSTAPLTAPGSPHEMGMPIEVPFRVIGESGTEFEVTSVEARPTDEGFDTVFIVADLEVLDNLTPTA